MDAFRYYQESLQAFAQGNPGEVFSQAGYAHLVQDQWQQAETSFSQGYRLKRGLPWNELRPGQPYLKPPTTEILHTSYHKLNHDREQILHLVAEGCLPEDFLEIAHWYEQTLQEWGPTTPANWYMALSPSQRTRLQDVYGRNLYLERPQELRGGALNPDLDWDQIQHTYYQRAPGMTYIDELLHPEALEALYRFCLRATIWNDASKSGGYVGSYMPDGFSCPLLFQIARELRAHLPGVIGRHPLLQMWGYKYDSSREGIAVHADAAQVNVNFWLTPDSANQNPKSGGLVVYDQPVPTDWTFERYNHDVMGVKDFLAAHNAQAWSVPHRRNRAVIFHSSLFHETDTFTFGPTYPERRINVTMLYGYWERQEKYGGAPTWLASS